MQLYKQNIVNYASDLLDKYYEHQNHPVTTNYQGNGILCLRKYHRLTTY